MCPNNLLRVNEVFLLFLMCSCLLFDVCALMINDCHTMAADGVTVVTVMTLVNHLWFLFLPENSVREILLKF